jgi:hypothetical protein
MKPAKTIASAMTVNKLAPMATTRKSTAAAPSSDLHRRNQRAASADLELRNFAECLIEDTL